MEGGHVHGREAVRAYWTRQWAMIDPTLEPASFHRTSDGAIVADVRQLVRDLQGALLQDKMVGHVFHLRDGKIIRFDIQEVS
ncbi:hypothetical protein HJB93_19295 [Rhizobium sp. NLR12b]|uniref:hypothetical protein n=1 Tax=Rhizobium sp. NLR12b TaxID=2731108 RepID=UPI001C835CAA|nr:hypothetical protein [Rhizobium sp. NLR12b]